MHQIDFNLSEGTNFDLSLRTPGALLNLPGIWQVFQMLGVRKSATVSSSQTTFSEGSVAVRRGTKYEADIKKDVSEKSCNNMVESCALHIHGNPDALGALTPIRMREEIHTSASGDSTLQFDDPSIEKMKLASPDDAGIDTTVSKISEVEEKQSFMGFKCADKTYVIPRHGKKQKKLKNFHTLDLIIKWLLLIGTVSVFCNIVSGAPTDVKAPSDLSANAPDTSSHVGMAELCNMLDMTIFAGNESVACSFRQNENDRKDNIDCKADNFEVTCNDLRCSHEGSFITLGIPLKSGMYECFSKSYRGLYDQPILSLKIERNATVVHLSLARSFSDTPALAVILWLNNSITLPNDLPNSIILPRLAGMTIQILVGNSVIDLKPENSKSFLCDENILNQDIVSMRDGIKCWRHGHYIYINMTRPALMKLFGTYITSIRSKSGQYKQLLRLSFDANFTSVLFDLSPSVQPKPSMNDLILTIFLALIGNKHNNTVASHSTDFQNSVDTSVILAFVLMLGFIIARSIMFCVIMHYYSRRRAIMKQQQPADVARLINNTNDNPKTGIENIETH